MEKEYKNNKLKIFVTYLLLFIAVGGALYSLYKIIIWRNENKTTENNYKVIMDNTKIEVKEDSTIEIDYSNVKKNNDDVVGWIIVNGTNINYPVVKTKDNSYYLTHSFDKSYNSAGWIFMDYRNNKDSLDNNTIIYGHNRKDGSMFGSMKNALNSSWYNNSDNLIIKYNSLDKSYLFQVFSVYQISETNDYMSIQLTDDLINTFLNRSIHNFNVDVSSADKILTLQTCSGSVNKLIMHAKLINE